ncbi:MAG TPA: 2Fe-2S iron-sulfur cluster binding domain-containing protein, partial [Moorella mulderi]|nr:2Fe-2S iron-sulfur cluster binding domain-containing protein [Moorella mulderi]
LKAAQQLGIKIPTLCFLEGVNAPSGCRMCVVEVKGARNLVPACVTAVNEGMEIRTNSPVVIEARRTLMELLLANHPNECLTCVRNRNCELQTLAQELGIREITYRGEVREYPKDTSAPALMRDPRKCVICHRCISVCSNIQSVFALTDQFRGFKTLVGPAFGEKLADTECVQCGQCVLVCPVAALQEQDDTDKVWQALADPQKHGIVQTAPAVRVQLGETMGMPPGSIVIGQMVAGLRRLGFDRVFDTNFATDVTIMEEGHEFLERLKKGGPFPMFTSCCPAWIKFAETFYLQLLDNISSCKFPQQVFGPVAKTYYAQKMGIDPKDIVVVSIMPCTAKKFEAQRPEMKASGYRDVDIVLTSRELGRMFKQANINLATLPEEQFDEPLGISTGAAAIFGTTGGVMEAALRTVANVVAGQDLPQFEYTQCRGLEGVKEATCNINGTEVKIAVVHGLANTRNLLEKILAGEVHYHFVEVMACPGGCIGGGGSSIPTDTEIRRQRMEAIYEVDRRLPIRKSHQNPAIKALYEEFLEQPLSHRSHELLHTHYTPRTIR